MIKKLKETLKYLLPFTVAVFIFALLTNYEQTMGILSTVWRNATYILTRFLIGFGIAYMMNFFVEWLRRRLRFNKPLAIAAAYFFFLSILAVMIIFIIPMVATSVTEILPYIRAVPKYPEQLVAWLKTSFPELDEESLAMVYDITNQTINNTVAWLQNLLTVTGVSDFLSGFARSFLNIFFGLIISAYALIEKPALIRRCKSLIYALFSVRRAGHIITVARESNRIFSSFLVGKILDSLIIGLISLPIYYLFGIPQAPFMALIAGVTNIVPYFGPMAGGFITVVILLFLDPIKAIYALGIVLVVQTFDGYFLGPRILGNAVGISPLLTIVAITLGGDLFGFMGIFLGVPAMAVFKTMVFDRMVARRLAGKQAEQSDILEKIAEETPPSPPPGGVQNEIVNMLNANTTHHVSFRFSPKNAKKPHENEKKPSESGKTASKPKKK